ncbi:MAG: hypothetical protein EA384_05205 [Spirochaetaceae bacterium]|nr:MAG: hypothetical protein EA384_05205 [Spirochaetaceae bacterium]
MVQNPGGSLPVLTDGLAAARPAHRSTAAEFSGAEFSLFQQALDVALLRPALPPVDHQPQFAGRQYGNAASADQYGAQAPSDRDGAEDARQGVVGESQPAKAEPDEPAESTRAPDDHGEGSAVKGEADEAKGDSESGTATDKTSGSAGRGDPAKADRAALRDRDSQTDADSGAEAGAGEDGLSADRASVMLHSTADSGEHVLPVEQGDLDEGQSTQPAVEAFPAADESGAAARRIRGDGVATAAEPAHTQVNDGAVAARPGDAERPDQEQKDSGERDDRPEARGSESESRRQSVRIEVRDLRPESEKNAMREANEARSTRIESEGSSWARRLQGDAERLQSDAGRGQASLSRALREQANPEIVRQARLVVRGESSGDIRLVLKPEHLGRVRIHLHLEDNRIAGRIIVENASVKEAFQDNLQALQRSLQQSGIESSGLEVSVGEGGGGGPERDKGSGMRRLAAAEFDELVPRFGEWYDEVGLVNMYA